MNYALYYGENADIEAIEQRYRALEDRFSESGVFPEAFYSSSGRAEVLGNHILRNICYRLFYKKSMLPSYYSQHQA